MRLRCCSKGIAPRSDAVLAALIARHNTDMPGIPFGRAVWLLCSMSIFQNGQEVNLDEFDDGQPLEVPRGSAEDSCTALSLLISKLVHDEASPPKAGCTHILVLVAAHLSSCCGSCELVHLPCFNTRAPAHIWG